MAENIKLKDLYAVEQTYDGIDTVKIPKADGSGDATFVVPPSSTYMLKESSYSGTEANSIYAYSGAESETTLFFNNVQKELYPNALPIPIVRNYTFGEDNIYCHPLESMTITELMNRIIRVFSDDNVTVTPNTYSVTPGWFHIKYTKTGEGANIQVTITEFEEVADPSTITFPAYLPWTINDANYFYSYIAEATQQVKAVTVTENGTQTINPDAGKSGLASVSLNVNVPSGGGNLQEKSVSITSNGTTEVTPDEGYDGMSKVKAVVNVAGGGSGVQANWAQNDNTAADYVKNRPGGFYIPGMSAQTVTFDGVETGRETVDLSALGMAGSKLVKVSDLMLYPINFDGCTVKVTSGGTETQVPSFTVDYKTDYGVATVIIDANFMPIIISVVSDYDFMGIILGAGTWFISATAAGMYVSSLTLPDTSGQMLNVNIPAKLLDIVIPKAGTETLGGVKADYAEPIPNIGDRVVIDSEGFLRYPYKAVTVNNDLTDEQKIAARKSINLYENAAFYGNFLINRDEVHSILGNVNNADGFLNFLFGIGNIVSGMNLDPYGNAVFGAGNKVSGDYHFVFGSHLGSADSFGLAIGQYNDMVNSANKAFVIGGGASEDNRKNVFSVDWDGNIEAGKSIILESSTAGSTKKFKITVDDTGTLKATEVTN